MEFKTKKEYRDFAKGLRANLDIEKISSLVCETVKSQDFYKKSANILAFYSFNSEIDLSALFKDDSKKWYLPSINSQTKEMFIHPYSDDDELIENRFGVPEPITLPESNLGKLDMILVPALMADKNGYRLGYGAGYYDRFLSKLGNRCIKVVPVPEALFADELPHDEFDVPVDFVVTEKTVVCVNIVKA